MIKEIWGNGTDVVVKYTRENMDGIWIASSKWMKNNSNMNRQWLIKNGYRRITNDINKKTR